MRISDWSSDVCSSDLSMAVARPAPYSPLCPLNGCAEALMTEVPLVLFDVWLAEASETESNDPNAMALATANAAGQPAVRMVLLKGHDARGFVFYPNQQGRKANDLAETPQEIGRASCRERRCK